jgi:hypothetical protein
MTDAPLKTEYDDGGRKAAEFEGETGDCLVRAIAIVTRDPWASYDHIDAGDRYRKIYEMVNRFGLSQGIKDAARVGLPEYLGHQLLTSGKFFNWRCVKLRRNAHLARGDLPNEPLMIASSKGHWCAVVARVILDTQDPTFHDGQWRVIKGVYLPPE